eukprot:g79368.t1
MIFLFLFLNESVNIKRLSNSSLLLFPLTEVEDHWQLMLPVGGSNQYTGKYLPAWLHGREEKQSINDPSTENKEFKAWEKDVLASHIISFDICMQPSGEIEGLCLLPIGWVLVSIPELCYWLLVASLNTKQLKLVYFVGSL